MEEHCVGQHQISHPTRPWEYAQLPALQQKSCAHSPQAANNQSELKDPSKISAEFFLSGYSYSSDLGTSIILCDQTQIRKSATNLHGSIPISHRVSPHWIARASFQAKFLASWKPMFMPLHGLKSWRCDDFTDFYLWYIYNIYIMCNVYRYIYIYMYIIVYNCI